jgi:hypothetical protein
MPLRSLGMIRGYYLVAIVLVLGELFVRALLPLAHLQSALLGHQLLLPLALLLHQSSILLKCLYHLAMLNQENNSAPDYFLTGVCKEQRLLQCTDCPSMIISIVHLHLLIIYVIMYIICVYLMIYL